MLEPLTPFIQIITTPTIVAVARLPMLPDPREAFYLKWVNQGLFFVYFWSFQTKNTIFTTNQCENVHSVYSVGIQSHDL